MSKQDELKKNLANFGKKPVKVDDTVKEEPVQSSDEPQPQAKRGAGRPKVHDAGTERTSITLDPIVMGKLRMMCLEQRRQLRDVIEEALKEYFERFEAEHGTIRVPATYRNK